MFRARGNKYGRKKVEYEGIKFDSKLELSVYKQLKADTKIVDIILQDKIYLTEARILSIIDFMVIFETGEAIWVEAKGKDTPVWRLKRKLWKYYGPGKLQIWKGSYNKPFIEETIVSKMHNF